MQRGERGSARVPIPIVALVLVIAIGVGVALVIRSKRSGDTDGKSPISFVIYDVDGSASEASLTITTPSGEIQQDAALPLSDEDSAALVYLFSPGSFVYISAQNKGAGTVTCHIHVNGVDISTNTASGQFNIATCEGHA